MFDPHQMELNLCWSNITSYSNIKRGSSIFGRQHPMATFTGKTSWNCRASPQKNQLSGRWVAWSIPPPNCGLCTALRWGLPRYRRCFSRLGWAQTTDYYRILHIYIYIYTTGYWSFVDLSVFRLFYDSATEHRSSAISKKHLGHV